MLLYKNMKKNQGFIPVWALLVALGVIVVGGGVWYANTPHAPAAPITQTPTSTASSGTQGVEGWNTYTDAQNGFSIQYPKDMTLEKQNGDVYLAFPDGNAQIYLRADTARAVPLMGSYGGWFAYNEGSTPASMISSDQKDGFTEDYFAAYAGMGAWDTAINAYQKANGLYYTVALYDPQNLPPGTASSTILAGLRNPSNRFVSVFDQILATFHLF